jgi:membrane protein required for beta-lactamase induction
LGDHAKAIAAVGSGQEIFEAWDLALELVDTFASAIDGVAGRIAEKWLTGADVEAVVNAYAPVRPVSQRLWDLLKPKLATKWQSYAPPTVGSRSAADMG